MWIETIWPSSTVTFSRTVRRPQIVRECEEGGICSPAGREGHAERLHAGHTRGIECSGRRLLLRTAKPAPAPWITYP